MKRLLFTAGGSPGMEAFYRYLSGTYELFFADMNIDNISPTIPRSRKFNVPNASSETFLKQISNLCKSLGIDLLIPSVDEELLKVLQHFSDSPQTKIFLPTRGFVSTMLNKYEMVKAFDAKGINVPTTFLAEDFSCNYKSPVILKPCVGRGSRDVFYLESSDLVEPLYRAIGKPSSSWIVQEHLEGDEFTVQMICSPSSELLGILPVKVNEKRGSTVSAVTIQDKDVKQYCESIHRAFKPRGCYNIQLIKKTTGDVAAFEINPRISTTTVLSVVAGLDPFHSFLEDNNISIKLEKVPEIKLHRHWVNEITVIEQ